MAIHFFRLTFAAFASFFFLLPLRTLSNICDRFYPIEKQQPHSAKNSCGKRRTRGRGKKWATLSGEPTQLFAHRGEKVLFPEHTLPGYEVAAILYADYLEPDLVLTKDGQLVCHHDLFLKDSTDVENHPEFKYLRSSYSGKIGHDTYSVQDDWFIKDFTLAELKTLRVRQSAIGIRPQVFNDMFEIPTYMEFLQLVQGLHKKLGRQIGIVPELKYPTFHNGLDGRPPHFMEDTFLRVMQENSYPLQGEATVTATGIATYKQVIVQCFEHETLTYISARADYETVLLIDTDIRYLTYQGIKDVARMQIGGLGIWKEFLRKGTRIEADNLQYPYDETEIARLGGFVPLEKLVAELHKYGRRLSVYTVKDSREFPTDKQTSCTKHLRQNKMKEMEFYFNAGVDAIFVENVAESCNIRENYSEKLCKSLRTSAFNL